MSCSAPSNRNCGAGLRAGLRAVNYTANHTLWTNLCSGAGIRGAWSVITLLTDKRATRTHTHCVTHCEQNCAVGQASGVNSKSSHYWLMNVRHEHTHTLRNTLWKKLCRGAGIMGCIVSHHTIDWWTCDTHTHCITYCEQSYTVGAGIRGA